MGIGRNELCHCGSGKKYKRCCIDEQVSPSPNQPQAAATVEYGPCVRCGKPGCGARVCKLCDKRHPHCHEHQDDSHTTMTGHILRVHPEAVPKVVEKLMANEVELALIRKQAERAPELWQPLMSYIAERQSQKS